MLVDACFSTLCGCKSAFVVLDIYIERVNALFRIWIIHQLAFPNKSRPYMELTAPICTFVGWRVWGQTISIELYLFLATRHTSSYRLVDFSDLRLLGR